MKKKFITLILSYQLSFGFTVTDPASYVYLMQQVTQMSEMIQGVTKQIETLGGIRTALDETKRQIYNAKDNLEGAFGNLQDSMKGLREATDNAEIRSLFDLGRDSISTSSTEGIFYKDITEKIQGYFDSADEAIMKDIDKAKLQAFDEEMKKINEALSANSSKDALESLNTMDFDKMQKNLLIKDYIVQLKKGGKEAIRQLALKSNNDLWIKHKLPNEEQKEKQKERQERVEKYISYIENSSDIYQQTQTTNMVLVEIMTILKEEYESALDFRNAMTLLFLENSDNQQFLKQVEKNQKVYSQLQKGQDVEIDDIGLSHIQNVPKTNPFGIGFRPYK
jgi:translation initiation factor 2B subunit (eIF-2B alpha/beta/delta family)